MGGPRRLPQGARRSSARWPGVIVGTTVWAVGGSLAIPVAVLTFVAAFFPIVGAVFAGIVATLVVLATAGVTEAVIVLVVVVIVQQLDGDILAPSSSAAASASTRR